MEPKIHGGRAYLRRDLSLAAVALAFFALLAAAVFSGRTSGLDLWLSGAARSARSPLLDRLMIESTYLGSWPVIVAGGVIAAICFAFMGRWRLTITTIASLVANVAIVSAIKVSAPRLRPDQLEAVVPASGASFPSGHSFSAVALYGLLALFVWRSHVHRGIAGAVLAIGACLVAAVGVSRVYVGAHWPTDVLASYLLGACWLAVADAALADSWDKASAQARATAFHPRLLWVIGATCWIGFAVGLALLEPGVAGAPAVG